MILHPPLAPLDKWESAWAAYDNAAYRQALGFVRPDDIVLDIGAGDLRLAAQMARAAKWVYAIENQPHLLVRLAEKPPNLSVICADARAIPWPPQITLGVLLMRHCTHVGLYINRLRAAGCRRLITNARWGLDVELVNLGERRPWAAVEIGWYACVCGRTGFVPGPPEKIIPAQIDFIHEVENCPGCTSG